MKTKRAMQKTGVRYFSSLTPKQKDKSVWAMTKLIYELTELPDGLARNIVYSGWVEIPRLDGCKMVFHEKSNTWFPLNIREMVSSMRTN